MARFPRIFITREWRLPQLMLGLLVLEFPFTVAILALFGIADGDTYRTKLWQNGADKGFNSAPSVVLYSFANYAPISTPLIWSSYLVQFNIVRAVLSMFLLLVKTTMFVLHAFLPVLSIAVHGLLIGLYAVSLRNQSSPDLADPEHLNKGLPWYLSKGCKYADPSNKGYCAQARASFAVTCVMLGMFCIYFLLSVWSLFPTAAEKAERDADRETDIEMKKMSEYSPDPSLTKEERWERNRQIFLNLPKTPNNAQGFGAGLNPMTPRTVAFTHLNGGEGPSRQMEGRRVLPFRQQYDGADRTIDAR